MLARARRLQLFFRIEHRMACGHSTQLRISESAWLLRDHQVLFVPADHPQAMSHCLQWMHSSLRISWVTPKSIDFNNAKDVCRIKLSNVLVFEVEMLFTDCPCKLASRKVNIYEVVFGMQWACKYVLCAIKINSFWGEITIYGPKK